MSINGTMMQYFEWYLEEDASLWNKLTNNAKNLHDAGITALWLPPAYKGANGVHGVGYTAYDLYDLGEFDQKGSVPTKYGTKAEYIKAIKACKKAGMEVYADIVLNHKIGADDKEMVSAIECRGDNREVTTSGEENIEVWTIFNFPGRKGKYSKFTWNHTHFDGTDWDNTTKKSSIYLFKGKNWENDVDEENGNYDYLMGADIDFDNKEVIDELTSWGKWYYDQTGVSGFRLDAVKHIKADFYRDWVPAMREHIGKDAFVVGEYWHKQVGAMENYLQEVNGVMSLFDVPLHFNFHYASKDGAGYDLRKILDGSLVAENPTHAVTFVDNHDTQPGQALESFVNSWFKPHAYAITLLRQSGYPCVFYGDYVGIPHNNVPAVGYELEELLKLRKDYAYGEQCDYFDDYHCIGWTRCGDAEHENSGLAVVLSTKYEHEKTMYVGKENAGKIYVNVIGDINREILISEDGMGVFPVLDGRISAWIKK